MVFPDHTIFLLYLLHGFTYDLMTWLCSCLSSPWFNWLASICDWCIIWPQVTLKNDFIEWILYFSMLCCLNRHGISTEM